MGFHVANIALWALFTPPNDVLDGECSFDFYNHSFDNSSDDNPSVDNISVDNISVGFDDSPLFANGILIRYVLLLQYNKTAAALRCDGIVLDYACLS